MSLKQNIKKLAAQYHAEVIAIRRYLHAHPELSFEEYETSKFIQQKLKEYDISYQSGMVDTGVVGLIEEGIQKASALPCVQT